MASGRLADLGDIWMVKVTGSADRLGIFFKDFIFFI